MASIESVSYLPVITQEPPKDAKKTDFPCKVSDVAYRALRLLQHVAYHGALIVAKVIAIPLEIAFIAALVSLAALSLLHHVPLRYVFDNKETITPFNHLVSLIDSVAEIVNITFRYGIYPESERLQRADDRPDSPQFVVITPTTISDTPPILYAPGYLDTPDTLRLSCRRIAESAQAPVYIVKYRALFQSIEEGAKDVARVHARMQLDLKRNDIIFIGHSMGGLTTGRCIQEHTSSEVEVKRWITLASPMKGTPLSVLGYGTCAKEMHPSSSVIQRLNSSSRLDSTPSLHIYSYADNLVPPESAKGRIGRDTSFYECKHPFGHLGMRTQAEVEAQVHSAILNA